jgi:GNAT-family acetyltransferase (TIGR03103 family)
VSTAAAPQYRSSRPRGYDKINRYSRVIVDEALGRGIAVEIVDPGRGELCLRYGARSMITFESLSELTSAVAFRRCDDKILTRSVLERAGLSIPAGRQASFDAADIDFLHEHTSIVVKPARGEQGWGITVGVTSVDDLRAACTSAQSYCPSVLLEEHCLGDDVRAVVIDGAVVAAAVRRPATVTGDGNSTVAELVDRVAQQRQAQTGQAGHITLDDEGVVRMVRNAGWELDSVLPPSRDLVVSPTANVHNGATIEDITAELHPALAGLAVAAASAIGLPVAGVDLIVDSVNKPDGTIIEVNEQPGLANHEPHPTAARFVDLLFPETATPSGSTRSASAPEQVLGEERGDHPIRRIHHLADAQIHRD